MKQYPVNEIFLSVQGEGHRAGTLNVFLRMAHCNQTCRVESHGFDCDTEFASHRMLTADEIVASVTELWPNSGEPNVIVTGGEPLLTVDDKLALFLSKECQVAVETNGSLPLPDTWSEGTWCYVACSPKVAEHAIRLQRADELRYVRAAGQGLPRPSLKGVSHRFISPAWGPSAPEPGALETCVELLKEDPSWRLSTQQHKIWAVR